MGDRGSGSSIFKMEACFADILITTHKPEDKSRYFYGRENITSHMHADLSLCKKYHFT
jgi:hypothetical protein